MAGVTIAEEPGKVAVAGNKVYCVFQDGVKCKLKKYNIKTKKSMVLKSYKGYQSTTDGESRFEIINHISVKGKYVYYGLTKEYGDSDGPYFEGIYRIKTNGKSEKRLAYGSDPVVVGDWIYYKEHKEGKSWGLVSSSPTGYLSRMKLDGTSKKRLMWIGKYPSSTAKELFKYGNDVLYSSTYGSSTLYSLSGKQYSLWNRMRSSRSSYQRIGSYLFYKSGSGYSSSVYRKNASGGSEKKIYSPDSYLCYLETTSKYLALGVRDKTYVDGRYRYDANRILLLNENGKVVAKIKG